MTIHVLATIDKTDSLVDDIDFSKLIELSMNQCIIIENTLARFIGQGLPDRLTITVGEIDDVSTCVNVKTFEEALTLFNNSVHSDAVIIGKTNRFMEKAIEVSTDFHLTVESSIDRTDHVDGRYAPISLASGWDVSHKEIHRATPKEGYERRVRLVYKKVGVSA